MNDDLDLLEAGSPQDEGEIPPGLDIYNPKERFIFKYFDGERLVQADPLILYRRVSAKVGQIETDITASRFPGYERADEAFERLITTLRAVFRIKPLEQGGLTETELEDLLGQFTEYCHWHKKKWNLIPILQTETSAPSVSLSKENPPISSSSVSGSTAKGPCTGEPKVSLLAQPSPTEESIQEWSIGKMSQ